MDLCPVYSVICHAVKHLYTPGRKAPAALSAIPTKRNQTKSKSALKLPCLSSQLLSKQNAGVRNAQWNGVMALLHFSVSETKASASERRDYVAPILPNPCLKRASNSFVVPPPANA